MARLADRIAYRLAGLVWTALYSGLCGGSAGIPSSLTTMTEETMTIERAETFAPLPVLA